MGQDDEFVRAMWQSRMSAVGVDFRAGSQYEQGLRLSLVRDRRHLGVSMKMRRQQFIQPLLAAAAISLALILLASATIAQRVDSTVLVLLGAAAVIILVPWEKLASLKAVGVEITLNLPHVREAVDSLDRIAQASGGEPIDNERVRRSLRGLESELSLITGSRVLWIDDNPLHLVGLRRLFRALGVEIVVCASSVEANHLLEKDNDFDLMISDLMRNDPRDCVTFEWACNELGVDQIEATVETLERSDGVVLEFRVCSGPRGVVHERREGVNFIRRLRTEGPDPVGRGLPVLFYASFRLAEAVDFARLAMMDGFKTEVTNTAETFVPIAIDLLARSRSRPIAIGAGQKVLVKE